MNKTHTIAKAIGQSPRKQAEYAAKRAIHTAECIIKTSKPRKKKVRQKEVEALKHRAESIEGNEAVETIITSGGEQPIAPRPSAPDTAGIPPEGFNAW